MLTPMLAQMLGRAVGALENLASSIGAQQLPDMSDMPALGDWLATEGLGVYADAFSEWTLDVLIQTAQDSTAKEFDTLFLEEVPSLPRRRQLFSAL